MMAEITAHFETLLRLARPYNCFHNMFSLNSCSFVYDGVVSENFVTIFRYERTRRLLVHRLPSSAS